MSFLTKLIYPVRCPVCRGLLENDGTRIHESCRDRLKYVSSPRCFKCGRQVESDDIGVCFECQSKSHRYDYGFPVFEYNDSARRAMLDYKKNGRKSNGEFFAHEAAERIGALLKGYAPQVLIPVPIHKSRLNERGFNQSAVLAEIIGRSLGIPIDEEFLVKTRKTAQQKSLSGKERNKSLSGAYECMGERNYERVCLVDDIYTTGNTLDECAGVLKKNGVRQVGFVAMCAGRIF